VTTSTEVLAFVYFAVAAGLFLFAGLWATRACWAARSVFGAGFFAALAAFLYVFAVATVVALVRVPW
jgi:hypothetical protein